MSSESTQRSFVAAKVNNAGVRVEVDECLSKILRIGIFNLHFESLGFTTLKSVAENQSDSVIHNNLTFGFYSNNHIKLDGSGYLDQSIRPGESTHLVLFHGDIRYLSLPVFPGLLAPLLTFLIWLGSCIAFAIVAGVTGSVYLILACQGFISITIFPMVLLSCLSFFRSDLVLVRLLKLEPQLVINGHVVELIVIGLPTK